MRTRIAWYVVLVPYTLLALGWLALGALVAIASYWPDLRAELAAATVPGADGGWPASLAQGVLEGVDSSEPIGQAVLDYLFSLLNLGIAAALWWHGRQHRITRLLTIALIGSAAAFNLQAHTGVSVLETTFGFTFVTWWPVLVLLHGVSGVAYVLALVLFPTGRWDIAGRVRWLARAALVASIACVLTLFTLWADEYPHPVAFVVFFGVLTPLVGLVIQRYRARHGPTLEVRRQSRLLFTALTMTLVLAVMLGVVTLALSMMHVPGLTLFDPSEGGALYVPTALAYWFVRLVFAAIPCALLIVTARSWHWDVDRFFSRWLAYPLVTVLTGTGYLVLITLINRVSMGSGVLAVALAIITVALLFQPLLIQVERILDRLVYGNTPAPYAVLAQVADMCRATTTDHTDLALLAEAVAHGLDASFCELTLSLPELGDHRYRWPAEGHRPAERVTFPLVHDGEQVGAMTVDRPSVTRLTGERRRLVDDLVGVLGPVLHNSRLGMELADQLRRARQRAEAIVASRRRAVAEMDNERRALERNLHDGAQHHLVALRMTVGLIDYELAHGRPREARGRLGDVLAQVDTTQQVLTDTAAGTFPITLAERGLGPALAEQLRGAGPSVVLDLDDQVSDERFAQAVESAVYFACLEAVNNARKHAPGATVHVSVHRESHALAFSVADNGPGFGFDPHDLPGAPGLQGIGDRTNAAGGTLTVHSAPGQGTTVEGLIPL